MTVNNPQAPEPTDRPVTEREVVEALVAEGRPQNYVTGYLNACRVYGYILPETTVE